MPFCVLRPLLCALGLLAVPLAAAERSLVLDSTQSRIEVDVKASFHSFTARLNEIHSQLAVDDEGRVTAAQITFRFRNLVTGKSDRDHQMHTWQQTDAHPDGSFVLTSLESTAPGAFVAAGELTFHGQTRALRFPVSIVHDRSLYAVDGAVPLDVREFGLPVIRMFGIMKVDPVVQVRFHLQARSFQ